MRCIRGYNILPVFTDRIFGAISNLVMAAPISGCLPIFSSKAFRIWRALEMCTAAYAECRSGLRSLGVCMATRSPLPIKSLMGNQAALSITLFDAMHSIKSFQDLTKPAAPSSRS